MNLQDMPSGTDNSHSAPIGHPITSVILYALSWLFIYLDTFTADQIWTWVWRGLSLISLLLIIYINLAKVRDIIKNKTKSPKE